MGKPKLDLSDLEAALASLKRLPLSGEVDDVHRDAAIRRFEYNFELCWKMMRRRLDLAGVEGTDRMVRRELFREAASMGLIEDPAAWFDFMMARNSTSHNYDQENAESVFDVIGQFAAAAQTLLDQLRKHHA